MRSRYNVNILIGGQVFRCTVCGGQQFALREIKMNTTGMSWLDLDWANASADGAVCLNCDYVHQFYGNNHQAVRADGS
ncbi:MAG: hypothetical protein LBG70_01410 [Bifidobacteriaceae bacterium]|jgi:predicted nucleic-acid-binding Zn-ribbon protein|nr:hypothetical protein [Bifidobacteriaceae bacterium]